ncbi:MAG TPA: HNH endonuclease, partial [Armatimonadota bacterium]|nr:HNH endonuclease [Armatimonadota bacterium]
RPLLEHPGGVFPDVLTALRAVPWRKRLRADTPPDVIECFVDWVPTSDCPLAPDDAEVWYDVPTSFDPPAHQPRFVLRHSLCVGHGGDLAIVEEPIQRPTPRPPRSRANYRNSAYRQARAARLDADHQLCVFCKNPATTVQHITYRRAGGNETQDDLRSLCGLCHDAVTMLEYGMGMGMDRINPEEPRWRTAIIEQRQEILRFRSLETRRRRLNAEEVE